MRPKNTAKDFWKYVYKSTDCWYWCGTLSNYGMQYGVARMWDKQHTAHRVAWMLTNGPIQSGICVLHRCDNPICVRPSHLFLGTRSDNHSDMVSKGRASGNTIKGEQHSSSKFMERQIVAIRKDVAGGLPFRTAGKKYGTSGTHVKRIVRREIWRHLP